MTDLKVYTFRDPSALSRAVVVWLYLDLGANILSGATAALSIRDAAHLSPDAPKDTPLPSDLLAGLAALGLLVTTAVVGFLVLKWIYRVSRNAHSAARGLTIRPPWAVGWFFVPVYFLWKPFKAMRETWQASTEPDNWKTVPVPAALRWWWGLFLAGNVLGQASFRTYIMATTLGDLSFSAGFDVAGAIVSIPLNLVFIGIVRELTQKQGAETGRPNTAPAIA